MVKRLTSSLLVVLLLGATLAQAQRSPRVTNLASSQQTGWFSSLASPLFLAWTGFNAACAIGCNQLYRQKNADLKVSKTIKDSLEHVSLPSKFIATKNSSIKAQLLLLQEVKSKREKLQIKQASKSELAWASQYDEAKKFDKKSLKDFIAELQSTVQVISASIAQKKAKNQSTEEAESFLCLYNQLVTSVSDKNSGLIAPQFKLLIDDHIRRINEKLKKPATNKAPLERRKASLNNLMKWLYVYDFSRNIDQRRKEKVAELATKITETTKWRDRLWIVPVAANALLALAYGINYFAGSSSK